MLVWKTGKKLLLCASVLILHGFFLSASALFLVRPHTKIKDEFLVELSSATKPCLCKTMCEVDPSCSGFTMIKVDGSDTFSCSKAQHFLLEGNLEANFAATTFAKKLPCKIPFTRVAGVGCLFISTAEVPYIEASPNCPMGYQLYSGKSDTSFNALRSHIIDVIGSAGMYIYFVDFTKDHTTDVWGWSSGRILGQMTWMGGDFPFASGEPNDEDSTCSFMHRDIIPKYGLADTVCSEFNASFICEEV